MDGHSRKLDDKHLRQIKAMTDRHCALEAEMVDLDRRLLALETKSFPQYLVSEGGKGAYHLAAPYENKSPTEWKTVGCGWRYSKSDYIRMAAVPE